MAVLHAKKRNALGSQTFGLPSERKYPMPDASHARNALARASEEKNKGALSQSQYDQIAAKAHAKLGSQRDATHKAGNK
jgi:hypothetical protein